MGFTSARQCKKCGEEESSVLDTREGSEGTIRRRKCKRCGYVYRTIEIKIEEIEYAG